MSIQVKLGGRSFSAPAALVDAEQQVELVIDTPRVILAPRSEVSLDLASKLLEITGKSCHNSEICVCSELQADIVAVIAIDKLAFYNIIEQWGSRALFTSPLLDMRHSGKRCLTIDASDRVCYMRLFDNGLQRAEAYDISTAEDILYYATEWLSSKETPIYIKGEDKYAKLLRKYFKQVICE